MLLAAGDKNGAGPAGEAIERVEVLDASDCPVGTRLLPEGEEAGTPPVEIDIDTFFSYPIVVKDNEVFYGEKKLCLNGNAVCTKVIPNGEVH